MPDPEDSLGGETLDGEVKADAAKQSLGDGSTLGGGDTSSLSDITDGEGENLAAGLPVIDLGKRFEIESELGKGGMGAVLLARDKSLGRQVAIKRILGTMIRSSATVNRFITEAKSIAALNHHNIVQIYEFGQDDDGPLIVIEYVSGGSLFDRLKKGKLDPEEAIRITCQLCDALTSTHDKGIIHRDIKPANVLLTEDGVPKLTDFGLAKQQNTDHGQTATGAIMGTLDYMPPEQRRDSSSVDERSDLWSLAAVFYQMLTGKSPQGYRLDKLPSNLAGVLGRMLEEDPAERFTSAAEFKRVLMSAASSVIKAPVDELTSGVCPACNAVNADNRKFCGECAESLRTVCLGCTVEMAVWDKICGDCGENQVRARNAIRDRFNNLLEHSNILLDQFEFQKAEETLTQIFKCDDGFVDKSAQEKAAALLDKIHRRAKEWWTENLDAMLLKANGHVEHYYFEEAERVVGKIPQKEMTPQVKPILTKIGKGKAQFESMLMKLRAHQDANDLISLETELALVEEFLIVVNLSRSSVEISSTITPFAPDDLDQQLQHLYNECGHTIQEASNLIQRTIIDCQKLISDGLPEEALERLTLVKCEWSLQHASQLLDELIFIKEADALKTYSFGAVALSNLVELFELFSVAQLCLIRWPNWKSVTEKLNLIINKLPSYPALTSDFLLKHPRGRYAPIQLLLLLEVKALPTNWAGGIAKLGLLVDGRTSPFTSEYEIPGSHQDASTEQLVRYAAKLGRDGQFESAIACIEHALFKGTGYRTLAGLKLRATLYDKIGNSNKVRAFQLLVAGSQALYSGAYWQARFLLIQSLGYDPNPHTLNSLAYLLATAPTLQLVEPKLAVKIAELANSMTAGQHSDIADTLACAYSAVGDFSAALVYSDQSIELFGETPVRGTVQRNRESILRSQRTIQIPYEEKNLETAPTEFVENATKGDSSWYGNTRWSRPRRISWEHIQLTIAMVLLFGAAIALLIVVATMY